MSSSASPVALSALSGRSGEILHILAATGRPPPLLHTKRGDRDSSRFRRQHEADHERTVLLAALHDVARLDEDIVVAEILDLELIDVTGFAHLHQAPGQRFFKRERHFARGRFTVDEMDREIFVRYRTGDANGIRRLRGAEAGNGEPDYGRNGDGSKQ
jgi:hypothetical protein